MTGEDMDRTYEQHFIPHNVVDRLRAAITHEDLKLLLDQRPRLLRKWRAELLALGESDR